ncbi:hypothetical protein LINPERPRIM_LOCUS17081 [Linum perenne]
MANVKDDSLQSVTMQLAGQNYMYWSYVIRIFLKGKSMWGYVSGTFVKLTDEKATNFANQMRLWEANNSKIITGSTTLFSNQ